jgi:hypothetical protein
VQHFSIKWLETTNLQLSQKSFKTCLRKLIIIATFIPRNNLLFYFLKIKKNQTNKKNQKKKLDKFFFFLIFRNCPQKSANGDAINIVNAFKVFLKKMKQKRPLKKRYKVKKIKKIKKKIKKKNQTKFFCFNFSKLSQKVYKGTASTSSAPSKCFLRGLGRRGH